MVLPLRFGVWALTHGSWASRHHPKDPPDASWERVRRQILDAESLGYDSTLLAQHIIHPSGDDQDLLETCMQIGRTVNKPVYVEEFVATARPGSFTSMNESQDFSTQLAAIENSGVPLASVWVYDRKLLPDRSNLTFDNDRAYMLRMIAEFDKAVHARN